MICSDHQASKRFFDPGLRPALKAFAAHAHGLWKKVTLWVQLFSVYIYTRVFCMYLHIYIYIYPHVIIHGMCTHECSR